MESVLAPFLLSRLSAATMILRLFTQIVVVLTVVLSLSSAEAISEIEQPVWSKGATPIWLPPGVEVSSPDKTKIAIISHTDYLRLAVRMKGQTLAGIENEGVHSIAEMAWAPDSTAFYITATDGGDVGTWLTTVYLIEKGRVRRIDVRDEIMKRSMKQYSCIEPEKPNIAAIKWLEGSAKLLFVAEVPPHSSCPDMGKLFGYIVSIPSGNIVEELDEKKLGAQWARYLGLRIRRNIGIEE